MEQTYTVVIAEDHAGVRAGIRRLIEKGGYFKVVGEAKDGKEAIQLVSQESPDLLILDVKLPVLRGEEVAKRLTSTNPDINILALSSFDNPQFILGMVENGVRGYLTKDEAPFYLQKAANDILKNRSNLWISDELKNKTGINLQDKLSSAITLSQIEHQILQQLKAGQSEKEIADQLGFSIDRVNRYIRVLLIKYEVETVQELIKTG